MWRDDVWTRKQPEIPLEFRERMPQMQAKYGVSGAEGLEAIRRMLASGLSQVVVSAQSIHDASGKDHLDCVVVYRLFG
jgi:hypothetical protein